MFLWGKKITILKKLYWWIKIKMMSFWENKTLRCENHLSETWLWRFLRLRKINLKLREKTRSPNFKTHRMRFKKVFVSKICLKMKTTGIRHLIVWQVKSMRMRTLFSSVKRWRKWNNCAKMINSQNLKNLFFKIKLTKIVSSFAKGIFLAANSSSHLIIYLLNQKKLQSFRIKMKKITVVT